MLDNFIVASIRIIGIDARDRDIFQRNAAYIPYAEYEVPPVRIFARIEHVRIFLIAPVHGSPERAYTVQTERLYVFLFVVFIGRRVSEHGVKYPPPEISATVAASKVSIYVACGSSLSLSCRPSDHV